MNASGTLVAGIGSPQGDDRAGWLVIDRLADGPQLDGAVTKGILTASTDRLDD